MQFYTSGCRAALGTFASDSPFAPPGVNPGVVFIIRQKTQYFQYNMAETETAKLCVSDVCCCSPMYEKINEIAA